MKGISPLTKGFVFNVHCPKCGGTTEVKIPLEAWKIQQSGSSAVQAKDASCSHCGFKFPTIEVTVHPTKPQA